MQQALYVALGALTGYLLFGAHSIFGLAALIVNLLTPLPAFYLGLRFGLKSGWLTILLTGCLLLFASGLEPPLLYLLQFGLPSGILAWLMTRRLAWDRAIFVTLGFMVVAALVGVFGIALVQQKSPMFVAAAIIDNEVSLAAESMQAIFNEAEIPPAELERLKEALESMTEFMRDVYAGLVIVVALFMLLALVFAVNLLARGRIDVPGPRFMKWKAPEPMIWLLILAGFMVFFFDGALRLFAMNLLVILLPVYFLQGLAVIDSFFQRKALSPIFRTVGYILVILVNPLPLLVTCIGVFDLWVDFRKPRIPKST
ncbi:MAG: DUF2232 domain-containing protein [Deltaproteobacteria bacterium]|jgi:uncharacterized protein YybS (DUF2232 family)|nr:DUF2232 domain-containing protein [Deltaproteobacteria bacterium]